MANGYMGKILDVDLTSGKMGDLPIDEAMCRDLIGGYGVGARLMYDLIKPGIDPLGPENVLGFFTGPFTGTPAPSGSRYVVVCKSPLTLTWGDANSGGTWGPNLKFAGYDGVILHGKAGKPVYLAIEDGKAAIQDAGWLWGKDVTETDGALKERHGEKAVVACIGPAGEKLSLMAAIINDEGRAAGRSGVGAVMGSKNLKAIVVRGDMTVPLADEQKTRELQQHYFRNPHPEGMFDMFKTYGTVGTTAGSAMSGDSPVKNWAGAGPVDIPQIQETFRDDVTMSWETRKYACWRCNLGCGGHMEIKEGMYAGTSTHKVEYETACAFGTMALNDDFPSTIKANDTVNRMGLDSISAPCAVVFAIECYENGILTDEDTGGLKLNWGNHVAMNKLLEQIGRREGLGDILADGVWRAAQKIGKGAEKYAIHVHGQEVPMHDPRFIPGLALTYKMDSTPARHTQGGEMIGPLGMDLPGSDLPQSQASGKGQMHKIQSTMGHVLNATGGCLFAYVSYNVAYLHEFLSAITGFDYTMEDMLVIGERIANIRHAFNLREGLNPLEFEMHGRLTGNPPLEKGNLRGVTLDVDTMVKEYCEAMHWDATTAKPSGQRLQELGLDFLASDVAA